MQADIKLLPCSQIWYKAAENKYYRGVLDTLGDGGAAIIIVYANRDFGDQWMLEEVPYGKDKVKHWYFHNISEATQTIMANLGRPLNEIEALPAHYVRQPEVKQEEIPQEEFVKAVVEQTLAEDREEKNGADPTLVAAHSSTKHNSTRKR